MSETVTEYIKLGRRKVKIDKRMSELKKELEVMVKDFAAAFDKKITGYAFAPHILAANEKRAKIVEFLLSKGYFDGNAIFIRKLADELGYPFSRVYNLTTGYSSDGGIYGLRDLLNDEKSTDSHPEIELKDPEQARKYLKLLPRAI